MKKKKYIIQQELQESDLTDHRSRIRRDDWQDHSELFAAQQIISSLTNIWSCKMCCAPFTQSACDREIESESEQQKRFKYTAYWERLPDATKLYTILEYLKQWTRKSRERNNGQKFSGRAGAKEGHLLCPPISILSPPCWTWSISKAKVKPIKQRT